LAVVESKHKSFQLMLVVWNDAATDDGWKSVDTVSHPSEVKSVGWCISDSDTILTLASDIGDNDEETETNRRISIPKDWIIKTKKLK